MQELCIARYLPDRSACIAQIKWQLGSPCTSIRNSYRSHLPDSTCIEQHLYAYQLQFGCDTGPRTSFHRKVLSKNAIHCCPAIKTRYRLPIEGNGIIGRTSGRKKAGTSLYSCVLKLVLKVIGYGKPTRKQGMQLRRFFGLPASGDS